MAIERRIVLRSALALVGAGLASPVLTGAAAAAPTVTVYRDESCSCCGAWVRRMEAEGFSVTVVNVDDLPARKAGVHLPDKLWSCHTATVEGYVVEGHVPPASVKRLLSERPRARGIAVAGMPAGSPGMEAGARKDRYPVMIFGNGARPAVWEWH